MRELRALHPDLHIDIDTGAHGLARLDEGLDAAIALATRGRPEPLFAAARQQPGRRDRRARACAKARRAQPPGRARRRDRLLHRDLPDTFDYWREAVGLPDLEPAAIDHFDSGQLILDAAAQGLGVAFMLESHLEDAHDDRAWSSCSTSRSKAPIHYWFACRRSALARRPVRIFHDWLFDRIVLPKKPA